MNTIHILIAVAVVAAFLFFRASYFTPAGHPRTDPDNHRRGDMLGIAGMGFLFVAAFAAFASLSSPAKAAELPSPCVERLLEISTELRRLGFDQEAQAIYDIATDCQFCADDHPEDQGQPWFCEDYLAEGEPPFPGCVYEGRTGD